MDELLWSLATRLSQQGFWKQQQFSVEEADLLRKALVSKVEWIRFFNAVDLDSRPRERVGGNIISDLQFNFRVRALLFEQVSSLSLSSKRPSHASQPAPKIRKPTVIQEDDYDKPETKPAVQTADSSSGTSQLPLDDMYYTLEYAYEEFLSQSTTAPSTTTTVTFADHKPEETSTAAGAATPAPAAADDGDDEIDVKPRNAAAIPVLVLSPAENKDAMDTKATQAAAQVVSPQRSISPFPSSSNLGQSPADAAAEKDNDVLSTSSHNVGPNTDDQEKEEEDDEGSVEPAGRSRGGRGTKKQTTRSRELRNLLSDVKPSRRWASSTVPGLAELYNGLESVLKALKENSDLKEQIAPFLTKVRKGDAPDYYDIIKKPMDFGQIAKKLKGAEYLSKKEFQDDLDLIYSNCRTYNTEEDSPYRSAADEVEKATKQLMAKVPDLKLDPHLMQVERAGGGAQPDEGTESDTPKPKKQRVSKAAAARKTKEEPMTPTKPSEEPVQEIKREPISAAPTQPLPPPPPQTTTSAPSAHTPAPAVTATTPTPAQDDRKRKRDEVAPSGSSSRLSRSQLHSSAPPQIPLASEAPQIRIWKEQTREQRQLQFQYRSQQSRLPFYQRDAVVRTPESMARYVQQQRVPGFFPESNAQLGSAVPDLHQPRLTPAPAVEHPLLSQSLMGANIRLLAEVRQLRAKVMREAELAQAAKLRAAAAAASATPSPSSGATASVGTPQPPATPSVVATTPATTAMQVDEATPPSMSSQPSLVMPQGLALPSPAPAASTPATAEGDATPSSSQLPPEGTPLSAPTPTHSSSVASFNPPPYVPPSFVSLPATAAELSQPTASSVYTDQLNVTLLRKVVVAVMAHAGFQGAQRSAVDVVTDLARAYFRKLGTVLNLASLKAQNPQLKEHALITALIEGGVNGYAGLRGFVENLQTYQRRLKDIETRWQSKLTHDAAEHRAEDVLDDGIALASGAFGDVQLDILGLAELGLGNLTIPSHLFVDPAKRTANMTKPTYIAVPKATDDDDEDFLEEDAAAEEGGEKDKDEENEEGEAVDANDDEEDYDADKNKRVGAIRSAGFAPALHKQ